MRSQYWALGFPANDADAIGEKLTELDAEGWEIVASWPASGDPHVNKGESRVYFLLRQSK